jgi:hypothetical protein
MSYPIAVGTIKATIKFFRVSTKRRSLVPNILLLCETRWSAKNKTIRVFNENFQAIFQQLEILGFEASGSTAQVAYQLQNACSSPGFLMPYNNFNLFRYA